MFVDFFWSAVGMEACGSCLCCKYLPFQDLEECDFKVDSFDYSSGYILFTLYSYFIIICLHFLPFFNFIYFVSLPKRWLKVSLLSHPINFSSILRFDILLFQAWPMVPTNLVTWAVICHSSKTKILAINPALPRVGVVVTVMRVLAVCLLLLVFFFSSFLIKKIGEKRRTSGVVRCGRNSWVAWLRSGLSQQFSLICFFVLRISVTFIKD